MATFHPQCRADARGDAPAADRGLVPDDVNASRLGLKLSLENRERMLERFDALLQEYAALESDPDGQPISLFFAEHPDLQRSERLG